MMAVEDAKPAPAPAPEDPEDKKDNAEDKTFVALARTANLARNYYCVLL